jgi:hypothetical protein
MSENEKLIRGELIPFVLAMENKLQKYDKDKGDSWKDKNWKLDDIRQRIHDEFIEYYKDYNPEELIDMANFIFFLWYHQKILGVSK